MLRAYDRREAALHLALSLALLAIGGAWFSELVLGYAPCKLCLWQRWPYYVGIPVMALALAAYQNGARIGLMRILAAFGALIFTASLGLGLYHAGVEWGFWLGPADCGGRLSAGPASVEDFRKALSGARVVLCNEAAGRVLGLSFAGWNAAASLAIAAFAFRASRARG